MGTNYYLRKPLRNVCEHCGRHDEPEEIHLGKSSLGWCFSLHVYPEKSLSDWPEIQSWIESELLAGSVIQNEYGDEISLDELRNIIANRNNNEKLTIGWDSDWWAPKEFRVGKGSTATTHRLPGYSSEEHFHNSNGSKRGPNGLLRHRVDGRHCIANGSGTWDCIVGDFS